MKKLISSRRGAAIELAIGVMFVMIALSIILVTNASLQNKEMKSDVSDLEQKIELMKITDWIIENKNTSDFANKFNSEFVGYEINVGGYIYTVIQGENTVLTIVFNSDGSIKSWN